MADNRSRSRWRRGMFVASGLLLLCLCGETWLMTSVQVGDRAPLFEATTHTGQTLRLADLLAEHVVVVYFYPRDNTPGCTTQACSFRDAYEEFTQAGAVVIGVSSDSTTSHQQFAATKQLPFELVSDPDNRLRKLFGVPKTFGLLPGRVTYVIDRTGVVRMVFNSQWKASSHVAEALRIVRQCSS